MRASFEPSVIQVAVLFGWSAYAAVRDRIGQLRARWRGDGPASKAPEGAATPPARKRPVDYSIN